MLNDYLPSDLGNLEIGSSAASSAIISIIEYGRAENGSLLYANPTTLQEPLGVDLLGSYNSFLKQECAVRIANSSSLSQSAELTMTRHDGTVLIDRQLFEIPAFGAKEIDLCGVESIGAYGETKISSRTSGIFVAEVMRSNQEGTTALSGSLMPQ